MGKPREKILLDIDGVIVSYDFRKLVKKYFGVDIGNRRIYAYDLPNVLGVKQSQIDSMFNEQVWGKASFITGALSTLNAWKHYHDIVIFSNRTRYMSVQQLAQWLVDNEIPFDGIDVDGKQAYDYHIDDCPNKLQETNSKNKLLFWQDYNDECLNLNKNMKSVKGWEEIRRIITI